MVIANAHNKSEYVNNQKGYYINNFRTNVTNLFGIIGSETLTAFYQNYPFFETIVSSVFERAAKNDYKAELSKNREYQLLPPIDPNNLTVSGDIERAYYSLTPDEQEGSYDSICKSVLEKITTQKDSLFNKFFRKEKHVLIVRDYIADFIYLKNAPILTLKEKGLRLQILQLTDSDLAKIPTNGTYAPMHNFPGLLNFITFSRVNKYFNSFLNELFVKIEKPLLRGLYMHHSAKFNAIRHPFNYEKADQLKRSMPTRIKACIDNEFDGSIDAFAKKAYE